VRRRRSAWGRAVVGAAVIFAALALPGARGARGAACGEPRDAAAGPLAGGTDAADFGAIPETCVGTDVGLRLRATVLVASEMPDFYGALTATTTLRLRHRLGRAGRTWLTVGADVGTFAYVVNGPVVSDGFSFGPPTLGVHRAVGDGERGAGSVYTRVLLPLDTAWQSGVRAGFELGATGRRLVGTSGRVGLEGGVAALAPFVVVAGQTHAAFQTAALVEGWFAPTPRLALFAGLAGRAELTPSPALLTMAPRVAVRGALARGFGLAMLIEAPVVGEDRTDLVAAVYLGWAAQNER
jgi:hypothetical protein